MQGLFDKLNSFQRRAVETNEKYVALRASVGSGKTTVIVYRVLYLHLIKKVPLNKIMVVTFTNKAAEELKERLKNNIDEDVKYIGTFHSIANRILRENIDLNRFGYTKEFKIISYEEASEIINDIVKEGRLNIKYKSKIQKRIEEFKNGNLLYANMKKEDDIKILYEEYRRVKKEKNLMDYEDLIVNCYDFLDEDLGIEYIIIDEFQDTDYMQLKLIEKIAGKRAGIFVVGDPNQTIYSFRTGTQNIFKDFIDKYNTTIFELPINYRSTRTITEAAAALIGEKIYCKREYGEPIRITSHYDAFNEANYILRRIKELKEKGVCLKDIAVLFRRQVQGELLYDVLGREVECEFIKGVEEQQDRIDRESVKLLTLHSSKGLEFRYVFIVGVNEGNIPISTKREIEEEELRLFFVGVTRAKEVLEISYIKSPSYFGFKGYKSQYISMLPKNLLLEQDSNSKYTLNEIYDMLRLEKEKKNAEKKVTHKKYGEGIVIYEDDNVLKVKFDSYGEKEFFKLFCQGEFI
ncbi:MAG: ATP-dependent helicase [Caloramator sp.]|nr:ATP-dependent helicase [Caloramator sp.]